MRQDWSKSWIASKQRRKKRKYAHNAPLHIRRTFIASHLSKDLNQKYKTRSIKIKVGDKVKILRGQFKKMVGKITRVKIRDLKVYIEGAELTKRDGTKAQYPIHPSNLLVIDLNLADKKRKEKLEKLMKHGA